MSDDHAQDLFDALDLLLEDERQALLAGDMRAISPLLERKETLLDKLQNLDRADNPNLKQLHKKVTRNQLLLDGALRGIRTVAARMGTLRRMQKTLDTYDQNGLRQTITTTLVNKIEKRA